MNNVRTPVARAKRPLLHSCVLFALIVGITARSYPQWTETNGPSLGVVRSFAATNTSVIAGADGGVFRSIDNGQNWKVLWPSSFGIRQVFVVGSRFFASDGGILLSTDEGRSWYRSMVGMDGEGSDVCAFAAIDTMLFVGLQSGTGDLYRSTDLGATWNQAETGLTDRNVQSLAVMGTTLFAGTAAKGVFCTSNGGKNWSHIVAGLTDDNILTLAVAGSNLYAGTGEGHVFLSTNGGSSWNTASAGLPGVPISHLVAVSTGDSSGTCTLIAATWMGAYTSADNGTTWNAANAGLTDSGFTALAAVPAGDGTGGTIILGGVKNPGVVRSTNNGAIWMPSVIPNSNITAMLSMPSEIFAAVYQAGLFRSTDDGATWTPTGLTPGSGLELTSLFAFGGVLFAGGNWGSLFRSTDDGLTWTGWSLSASWCFAASADGSGKLFAAAYGGGVFLSTDTGMTWNFSSTGLTDPNVYALAALPPDTSGSGHLLAATSSGVFRSSDNGVTWAPARGGLPDTTTTSLAVSLHDGTADVFATRPQGLFRSTDNGSSWMPTGIGGGWGKSSIFVDQGGSAGTTIFFASDNRFDLSTDNGIHWSDASSGLHTPSLTSIAVSHHGAETNVFAGSSGSGVWKFPYSAVVNNDTNWTMVHPGLENFNVVSIVTSPAGNSAGASDVFAVCSVGSFTGGGVYRSTDNGVHWTPADTGSSGRLTTLAVVPASNGPGNTNLLGGAGIYYTSSGATGLFRSSDNGTTWSGDASLQEGRVFSVAAIPTREGDDVVLAVTQSGQYRSTDNGTTWTRSSRFIGPESFASTTDTGGTRIFSCWDAMVVLSTDEGITWTDARDGLPPKSRYFSVAARGSYRFVGLQIMGLTAEALYRSTDDGVTWLNVHPGTAAVYALAFYGSTLFAGTSAGEIYLSTDLGTSWAIINSGLMGRAIYALAVAGDSSGGGTLLAGTSGGGVWRCPLAQALSCAPINLRAIGGISTPSGATARQVSMSPTIKPGSPATCTTRNNGKILLNWSRDHHADFLGYRVYADTTPHPEAILCIVPGIGDTSRLVTRLLEGKHYYFRVTAMDLTGYENNWSNQVTASPAPPMKITATPGIRKVLLHWAKDERTGVVRYRVYCDTSANPVTLVDSTTGGATDTSRTILGLANAATYYFRITALDTLGFECDWSNDGSATPGLFPSALTAVPGNSQVALTWGRDDHPDVAGYRIYGGTAPHPATLIDSAAGPGDTIRFYSGLTNGVPYYYRVTSVDSAGRESAYSNEAGAMPDIFVFPMTFGWNMVAVPLSVADYRTPVLYPFCASRAYGFDGGYVPKDTLVNGRGYWLKLNMSRYVSMDGSPRMQDTVGVREGWNMIGSISSPVPAAQICSDPGGMVSSQFFTYAHRYLVSDTIEPGRAYWVKMAEGGKLILAAPTSTVRASQRIRVVASGEMPPAPPDGEGLDPRSAIPDHYALDQNYPNPFNPATNFVLRIADFGMVTLKVYDVLGREVATPVNEVKQPGAYNVKWDASRMPSGIYFYRLQTGRFTATKKLLLLK